MYKVNVEIFEGPMDLLLHLIKKNDLDIYDIPISQITSEYLTYLDLMKELNLDIAGQFLVMAATLIQIKSALLLPPAVSEVQEIEDPRADLVARLLEYQKFKEASKYFQKKEEENRGVFYRGMPLFSDEDFILEADLFDLMGSFRTLLHKAKADVQEILYEDIPIEEKIREILSLLEEKEWVTFEELFINERRRLGLIVGFLAVLELIRLKQIIAYQNKPFSPIRVRLLKNSDLSEDKKLTEDSSVIAESSEDVNQYN
ncbi:MAG: segregation/condensation protein A [bacterium]